MKNKSRETYKDWLTVQQFLMLLWLKFHVDFLKEDGTIFERLISPEDSEEIFNKNLADQMHRVAVFDKNWNVIDIW